MAALFDVAIDVSEKPRPLPSPSPPLNGHCQFPLLEAETNTSHGCNGQWVTAPADRRQMRAFIMPGVHLNIQQQPRRALNC